MLKQTFFILSLWILGACQPYLGDEFKVGPGTTPDFSWNSADQAWAVTVSTGEGDETQEVWGIECDGDENCISSPVTYGSQPEGTKETMAGPEQLTEGQTYSVIVVGETESDWLTGLTSVSWHATFTPPSEKTVKLSELEAE